MWQRTITALTFASLATFAATLVLIIASWFLTPSVHRVSVTDGFHVGVTSRGFDSRIVFFSDSEYGPYQGSIVALSGDSGEHSPRMLREDAFGDFLGVYYRYFESAESKLWTFAVSLWYPLGLSVFVPLSYFVIRGQASPVRRITMRWTEAVTA